MPLSMTLSCAPYLVHEPDIPLCITDTPIKTKNKYIQ